MGSLINLLLLGSTAFARVRSGDAFPPMTLPDLHKGEVTIPNPQARVTVVDFWASWCEPCRDELPALDRLQARYKPEELRVIGVNVDGERGDAKAMLARAPVGFANAFDGVERKLVRAAQPPALPTAYVVDKTGRVRAIHRGFSQDIERALESNVKALLKSH